MRVFLISLLAIFKCGDCQLQEKPCVAPITTASGSSAPTGKICAGDLILHEEFEELDLRKWQHENTLAGGGNWEFQWYTNNRTNSYIKNKILHITPTLTEDQFGEEFLTMGTLNVDGGTPADRCTNAGYSGCQRTGTPEKILNPVKSARISTAESFRFKYGKVEVSAKMPGGDWLWPAIWLLPYDNAYGSWPASGEIDLVESRGNKQLKHGNKEIGTKLVSSALRFGPFRGSVAWEKSVFEVDVPEGADTLFKLYQMEWTRNSIKFSIDDMVVGEITPPEKGGFFNLGKFPETSPGIHNPWKYGTKMAPFDHEFFLIINLAVGGVNYFPDDTVGPNPKPWRNTSPTSMKDFYSAKTQWLKTWTKESSSLQVEYVKIWAL